MPLTNKEYQAAYKRRMYEAGYKQMQIWVPKKTEGKAVKIERKIFMKRLESLTAGWSNAKLNKLLKNVLNYISDKIKKEDI